jgi:hypothetical protein
MIYQNEPSRHHYVPQFYLRNFAVDKEQLKIPVVSKESHWAIWSIRSIKSVGWEPDFYVHFSNGKPVSIETDINRTIETPLSQTDTWAKISSGRGDTLDRSDKAILYALIKHLRSRTPHRFRTMMELAAMAAPGASDMPFTPEEREMYGLLGSNHSLAKQHFNATSLSLKWTEREFDSARIGVHRSPIPLRTSTTPVIALKAPDNPGLHLPYPGMVPYMDVMPLSRHIVMTLVLGDFDGDFVNTELALDEAQGFNRHYVAQFAHFPAIRHLIADREGLIADMTWARYELATEVQRSMKFKRTA